MAQLLPPPPTTKEFMTPEAYREQITVAFNSIINYFLSDASKESKHDRPKIMTWGDIEKAYDLYHVIISEESSEQFRNKFGNSVIYTPFWDKTMLNEKVRNVMLYYIKQTVITCPYCTSAIIWMSAFYLWKKGKAKALGIYVDFVEKLNIALSSKLSTLEEGYYIGEHCKITKKLRDKKLLDKILWHSYSSSNSANLFPDL
jgi:hypothetical protein